MLTLSLVAGIVIFTAIWVIGAAITFWTVETSEVTNVFTYGGEALVSYPMPIYGEGIRWFFTYIVPLAFVSYLPAIYILEKSDPLGLPPILQVCSPIVAGLFLVASRFCWAFGVRHYQGTGSSCSPCTPRSPLPRARERGSQSQRTQMIEAENLRKTFRIHRRQSNGILRFIRREAVDIEAVAGVSFSVAAGEMVGYVGPNGAGKSTTIKMLTGILQASGGHIRVAGLDPARQRLEVAKRIGVVFGQRSQLWWDLPLADSFELLRHIYRVPTSDYRQRLAYLSELLELGSFLETPVRQLSLGQRMRGDLTASLLHAPSVLFLDEPSIGLDVVAKARIRELLAQINREQGVTMLLTTHDMADIERLCSRMLIIDHGRVIYDGGVEAIREQHGDERTVVVDLEEASRR